VIEGDPGKIRQVLLNLLSNAAKFTQAGRIELRATCSALEQGAIMIAIAVRDTGVGIAPDDLERIFDAFDQAAVGARSGGTGLGLTISRSFARLMRGDLTVESTKGLGSTFTFTFQARATSSAVRTTEERALAFRLAQDQTPVRVLIVDDEPVNRALLEDLLSGIGLEPRSASSGEAALTLHASWQPQVVLMDLRMEGMDGFQTTRRLRASGSTAVIIALTASAFTEVEHDARAAGADDFLRKPYRESELLVKIAERLGLRYSFEPIAEAEPAAKVVVDDLSRLIAALPHDLIAQLREATIQARPERIELLTRRAAQHSEAAAAQINALVRRFDYDALLSALG
jgi:CheY-like chemotaxis protein